jgi:flagellar M-ring protein FliF
MPIVDVDRLKRSGEKFASGFTPGQKVVSVLGAVALVFAMFAFTKWSATAEYAPLFSNLSGKDAGDITKALDSLGVKWKLADGGNTVLVPKADVYTARVSLSSKGLPANTDGYALLDQQGITTSEFTQRVDYQRAVQTELAKTITAIHGVSNATVNLALPPDTPFVGSDAVKAKASVQIDTGSSRLPDEQVQSIAHLVASAVKDLSTADISITDTNGNDLYSADAGGSFASAHNLSKQLAYQDSIQRQI